MAAAVDRAYVEIKSGILAGRYAGGMHIAAADLAEALGVSRTPVREAMRRLHAEGLVNFLANRGAYVATWDQSDVDDVFDLRAVLESHAARLATRNASSEQLDLLEQLSHLMDRAATDRPKGYLEIIADHNNRFHELIRIASGSRRLRTLLPSVIEMPLVMQTFNRYGDEDLRRSMAHHAELVVAMRTRDEGWAASVMRCHITAAHQVFKSYGRRVGEADARLPFTADAQERVRSASGSEPQAEALPSK